MHNRRCYRSSSQHASPPLPLFARSPASYALPSSLTIPPDLSFLRRGPPTASLQTLHACFLPLVHLALNGPPQTIPSPYHLHPPALHATVWHLLFLRQSTCFFSAITPRV